MGEKSSNKCNNAVSGGTVWFIGWLFTIAFADLGFWKAVIGLLIWPWYLGDSLQ